MNGVRVCGVLLALAAIGFGVVWLRAEQTRAAARTMNLAASWIELRRELWSVQAGVARLRTPRRIREGIVRFDDELVPPAGPTDGASTSLVHDRP